jgi:sterol desaturase/sphingolipid hydroxylase (fatty acid hydroxylase superfamily)
LPSALFIVALATAIEFVAPIERHSLKSRAAPTFYWIVGFTVGTGCLMLLAGAARALGVRPVVSIPASGWGATGDAVAICASVLFGDFLAYWYHRFQHRFIWRIHALHHSPTQLNAVSNYTHFGEQIVKYLLIGLPLTVVRLRFPAAPFLVIGAIELLDRYIHSPIDAGLGPFGKVFVDNRFHRIHHSLEERHFDKNFGILFSFWDRLFGTAYEPGNEWPAVGIAYNPPPATLWQFLSYPLRYNKGGHSIAPRAIGRSRRPLTRPVRHVAFARLPLWTSQRPIIDQVGDRAYEQARHD